MWKLMESKIEMSEGNTQIPKLENGVEFKFHDVKFGYKLNCHSENKQGQFAD